MDSPRTRVGNTLQIHCQLEFYDDIKSRKVELSTWLSPAERGLWCKAEKQHRCGIERGCRARARARDVDRAVQGCGQCGVRLEGRAAEHGWGSAVRAAGTEQSGEREVWVAAGPWSLSVV